MEELENNPNLEYCEDSPLSGSEGLSFYQYVRGENKLDVYIGVNENTNHIVFSTSEEYWPKTFDSYEELSSSLQDYLKLITAKYLHKVDTGHNWILAGSYEDELYVLTDKGDVKCISREEYNPGILRSYYGPIDFGELKFAYEEVVGDVTLGCEFVFENGFILIEIDQEGARKNSYTPFVYEGAYTDHIEVALEFKNINVLYSSEEISSFLVKNSV